MGSWLLNAEPAAAARARGLARDTLTQWGVNGEDLQDVVLIVDELVTNAIVHGRGPISLAVRLENGVLVGEVGDRAPVVAGGDRPAGRSLTDGEWGRESGRGLWLVRMLAADHGLRHDPVGKTVWFTRVLAPV
jgi:anti-sigma regulatory factor (Ser/Thr protein kinase)